MQFRLGEQNMAKYLFSLWRLMSRPGIDAARRMNVAPAGKGAKDYSRLGVAITH